MPSPRGFDDPALASYPPAGNLYFSADQAVAAKDPGEPFVEGRGPQGGGQAADTSPPSLIFGQGAVTGSGEQIVNAADSSTGHFSEVLNFHGSPAPWVLIGVLLVAGILHLQASGKLGVKGAL